MITQFELEEMGKQAARAYITDKTPLNDSIKKFAKERNLTPAQMQRIIENSNVETYLALHKTADDKYIEFPVAGKESLGQVTEPEVRFLDDYEKPPQAMEKEGTIFNLEKVAEVEPIDYSNKVLSATKDAIEKLEHEKIAQEIEFNLAARDFEGYVRQLLLSKETSWPELAKVANRTKIGKIIFDNLEIDVPKTDETEVIGIVNEEHPFVSELSKVGELLITFLKTSQTLEEITEDHEELKKEGGEIREALRLIGEGLSRAGKELKPVGAKIIKLPFKHKATTLAIGSALGVYHLGKHVGKAQVSPRLKNLEKYRRSYRYE